MSWREYNEGIAVKRLEKNEFKKLTADIPDDTKRKCKHNCLVRLYTIGAKSDYGCLDCGMESPSISDFRTEESVVLKSINS